MKISELFYTIQGEGKRLGRPSFFVRTNFCNLRCKFSSGNLCDTAYTSWYPNDLMNVGEVSIDSIVKEYSKVMCNDVVITGGEPTMYLEDLQSLCKEIKKCNEKSYITIETNGTFIGDFVKYINLASISPKLESSTPFDTEYEKMHSKNRINLEVLRNYNQLHSKNLIEVQWKFVYSSQSDIEEILDLQKKVGFLNEDIYLMPEGRTEEDLSEKRIEVVEKCKKYKFNYTDRLHVIIWGNKRGV